MVTLKRYMFHEFVLLFNYVYNSHKINKQSRQHQIGRRWQILLDVAHMLMIYDDERDASSSGMGGVRWCYNILQVFVITLSMYYLLQVFVITLSMYSYYLLQVFVITLSMCFMISISLLYSCIRSSLRPINRPVSVQINTVIYNYIHLELDTFTSGALANCLSIQHHKHFCN